MPTITSTFPVPVDSALIVVPEPWCVTFPTVVIFTAPLPVVSAVMTLVAEPVDLISLVLFCCLNSTPACPVKTNAVLDPDTVIEASSSSITVIFVLPVLVNE